MVLDCRSELWDCRWVIRLLFLGDIVGEPGRRAVIQNLKGIKRDEDIDFVIANGENAAGGRGITKKIAIDILRAGVEVITLGDHTWDQKEVVSYLPLAQRVIRPLNFGEDAPGSGSVVIQTEHCGNVAVVNGMGRVFINPPLDNPFVMIEGEVDRIREKFGPIPIFVDFHAEATSEKIAMGRHLDGKVSAVVGTHTHVQTADERVFPGGTAFLCDAGMCGPDDSVLGRAVDSVVYRFKKNLPTRFPVAKGPVRLCGAVVDIDEASGKAVDIRRFSRLVELA